MDITDETKLDTIYNYNPAYNNLYQVEIYLGDYSLTMTDYLSLHAVAVSFGQENLSLVRNDASKKFQLDNKGFTLADSLSITWRENDAWVVHRYHETWLGTIYNRDNDRYKCYEIGDQIPFYRTVRITLPKSKTESNAPNVLRCNNVIPKAIPRVDLRWGPSAQVIQHTIEYYVESWSWEPVGGSNG